MTAAELVSPSALSASAPAQGEDLGRTGVAADIDEAKGVTRVSLSMDPGATDVEMNAADDDAADDAAEDTGEKKKKKRKT